MPRRSRSLQGGLVHHVLNRASGRQPGCRQEADYEPFKRVIAEASARAPLAARGVVCDAKSLVRDGWAETDGQVSSSSAGWP
jgi:hypothetical protein